MYEQEECSLLMKDFPPVDIFISHCPPKWINDNFDNAHEWFIWIKEYIDKNNVKFLFHWHTYDYWNFVDKYKEIKVIYTYWTWIYNIDI